MKKADIDVDIWENLASVRNESRHQIVLCV